jgi:hypothetical protein
MGQFASTVLQSNDGTPSGWSADAWRKRQMELVSYLQHDVVGAEPVPSTLDAHDPPHAWYWRTEHERAVLELHLAAMRYDVTYLDVDGVLRYVVLISRS